MSAMKKALARFVDGHRPLKRNMTAMLLETEKSCSTGDSKYNLLDTIAMTSIQTSKLTKMYQRN